MDLWVLNFVFFWAKLRLFWGREDDRLKKNHTDGEDKLLEIHMIHMIHDFETKVPLRIMHLAPGI